MVSVIPNAVVASNFRPLDSTELAQAQSAPHNSPLPPPPPQTSQPLGPNDTITIVVISRLFYNKGTDLLIASIPRILATHPNVRFIIAGSGPKAIDLEQMLDRHILHDRVSLLGPVRHEEVRNVMVRGHIYLHPSLTEAFGTVLVEAASCNLLIVCTRVGGIPEVLPGHMTVFAKPEEDDLVRATGEAVGLLMGKDEKGRAVRRERFHEQVRMMYSWSDIARRTERVYDLITGNESDMQDSGGTYYNDSEDAKWRHVSPSSQSFALIDRLKRYYGCGIWAGKLFVICVVIDYLLFVFLELWFPRRDIDICRDWPKKQGDAVMVDEADGKGEDGAVRRRGTDGHAGLGMTRMID
jgi:phosphatidylinositol glycan class A protein